MSHLILVRHTAVAINPERSSHDWSVSEEGRRSAKQLARRLATLHPTRILTSTEAKASTTGEIMADVLDLPWATATGLQEQDRRGAPYFPDKAVFEDTITRLFKYPNDLIFGNETGHQARRRFETAVLHQIKTYPDDTLLLVSHGTVLALFLSHYNPDHDPFTLWRSLTLPWAGVVELPQFSLSQHIYQSK